MCVVSMVGDFFDEHWKQKPWVSSPNNPNESYKIDFTLVTRAEFEALKTEVRILKELLVKAKEYDTKNNEPNCSMEHKVKLLKEIAKQLGVELDGI